ncbi:10016_t:CDS:2 [Cetraspora pellucida]|uniref:10016_t:CDS:1 n=1 Tax=Cetraspora pellucida TaxID=1433469 RepID=A0A9N9EI43_9GLOM|nr:10016_t:CDS:2 [Cetraspora pellucida]
MADQPDLCDILAAVTQLQLDNQALQQDNVDLRNTLNYLRAQGGIDNQHKEPKVRLPDKFDGSRVNFRGFLNQVRLIIRMQPNRYPNDHLQVGLLGSLLTGLALAWFTLLLKKQSPLLETFEDLVRELEATFGDSEKSRTAANRIRKLVQGTRPASSYASEFRQIAGDLDWGEAALIDQFRSGLRSDVKDLLLSVEDPTSLNDAVSKAVKCNNRLYERRQECSWDLPARQHHSQPITRPAPFEADPMQIDTVRIKPLLAAEKRRCRANNLCFYCGDPGHIVKNCSKKSSVSPRIDTIVFSEELSGKEQPQSHPNPVYLLPNNRPVSAFTPELYIHLPNGTQTSVEALIDSGASACFLDLALARELNLPIYEKKTPLSVEVVDSQELSSGSITQETGPIPVHLQDHSEEIIFNLIPSPHYKVILRLPWLTLYNPEIKWRERIITFSDPTCSIHLLPPAGTSSTNKEQIFVVQVFSTGAVDSYHTDKGPSPTVPEKYQEFSDVFSEKEAYKLPKNRQYDCAIDLLPDMQPPWGLIYELSTQELETLRGYIEENLEKGFIHHSKSPAGVPVLFYWNAYRKMGCLRNWRNANSTKRK